MAQSKASKPSKKEQKASEAVKAQEKPTRSEKEVVDVSEGESDATSESASESESASSSGSESSASESESSDESPNQRSQGQNHPSVVKPAQPPRVFTAPEGFKAVPTASIPSSKAARLFSSSNLAGKQIWHITAPASVPIDSIKEVALENVQKGESVLSHKGAEYGFSINETPAESNTKLLVPSGSGNGYQLVRDGVAQSLHLHQLVRIPNLPHAVEDSPEKASEIPPAPAKKPVRQQPEDLKMRFFPIGSRANADSDTEMADADDVTVQKFRMPTGADHSSRKEKRKLHEVNGTQESEEQVLPASNQDEEARRKKHKHKHKSDKEIRPSAEGESKEERGRKEHTEADEHERRRETSEERAKRKRKEKKREEKSKSKEKKSSKH
ncbi:hypothetical protein L228DRAFT_245495 [Xylona heveae TC161]|uniref:DNA-directed RNA polymerase I subunit RPA34.5 n=1 Tax=Xylona heveae (strain CBS 132557 / TC161) TaxID=1328760 RepID=A0A165I8H8_XYLHT|nr:hypothetical protein L228DRAFT_245495 [Xylona heveae TC161]KZF24538.1 hypothetical protein L228DRAFT_245495 [Xylona heveae TC161]